MLNVKIVMTPWMACEVANFEVSRYWYEWHRWFMLGLGEKVKRTYFCIDHALRKGK